MRTLLERDGHGQWIYNFGKPLPPRPDPFTGTEDWKQASPPRIRAALERAQALPRSGFYVVDASRRIGSNRTTYWVDGHELCAFRGEHGPILAANACPHMGAALSDGHVCKGEVVCPWHGLRLGAERHGTYRPLEVYDDGYLVWVRPETKPSGAVRPVIPRRPSGALDACIRLTARCDPSDVIANRLDPWHGIHFHPHSFRRLRVLEFLDDRITVRVAVRVAGPFCVEVDATFHCVDPNTIVMTIVEGDGVRIHRRDPRYPHG